MKSKLELYALSVCFASVVCLVVSAGIGGFSIVEIIAPELTMSSYKYDKYQTNETFWKDACSKDEAAGNKPGAEVLTKQRTEEFAVEITAERREGFQTLVRCLMFILASGTALLVHWNIAKKARAD